MHNACGINQTSTIDSTGLVICHLIWVFLLSWALDRIPGGPASSSVHTDTRTHIVLDFHWCHRDILMVNACLIAALANIANALTICQVGGVRMSVFQGRHIIG